MLYTMNLLVTGIFVCLTLATSDIIIHSLLLPQKPEVEFSWGLVKLVKYKTLGILLCLMQNYLPYSLTFDKYLVYNSDERLEN